MWDLRIKRHSSSHGSSWEVDTASGQHSILDQVSFNFLYFPIWETWASCNKTQEKNGLLAAVVFIVVWFNFECMCLPPLLPPFFFCQLYIWVENPVWQKSLILCLQLIKYEVTFIALYKNTWKRISFEKKSIIAVCLQWDVLIINGLKIIIIILSFPSVFFDNFTEKHCLLWSMLTKPPSILTKSCVQPCRHSRTLQDCPSEMESDNSE